MTKQLDLFPDKFEESIRDYASQQAPNNIQLQEAIIAGAKNSIGKMTDALKKGIGDPDETVGKDTEKGNANPLISTGGFAEEYLKWLEPESERRKLYQRYDQIERSMPEVATALDMYADYAVQGSLVDSSETFSIKLKDEKLQNVIKDTMRRIGIHQDAWRIVRQMCKTGDSFWEPVITPRGLDRIAPRSLFTMSKRFDEYHNLIGYKQSSTASLGQDDADADILFPKWQICHWMISDDPIADYGTSILYGIERLVRILELDFDGLTIARLTNSQARFKWIVDTGTLPPDEQLEYLRKFSREQRRKRTTDPVTGHMRIEQNPLRHDEDLYVPRSRGASSDVSRIPGDQSMMRIADVDLMYDRLFVGLRMHRTWFTKGTSFNNDSSTAVVNFMRAVRRVREAFSIGVRKLVRIALRCQGVSISELDEMEIEVIYPMLTHADDMLRIQVDQAKLNLAKLYLGLKLMDRKTVLLKILKLSDEEADRYLKAANSETPPAAATSGSSAPTTPSTPSEEPVKDQAESILEQVSELFDSKNDEIRESMANLSDVVGSLFQNVQGISEALSLMQSQSVKSVQTGVIP
jgi:hypothetical protein